MLAFIGFLFFVLFALLPAKQPAPLKIKVKLYSPHKGQKRIHKSKARFRVVACGRRYGKTLLACNEIVGFALSHPNANCAWVAPWVRQSKIVYRLIRRAFAKSGDRIIAYKSDTDLRLVFANGSVIQFFGAENHDSIRGDGYHFVVIDEAGDALKDPSVWTDSIRAALSDTDGKALIIGTPKRRNLFFQLFARGDDPEFPDWESFTAPTASNPFIPAKEIEAARRELPEDTFQQEYEAVFLEDGAGVFRHIADCIRGLLDPEYKRVEGHVYAIGWDPAKYQDFSVVTLIDCNMKRVVAWKRINQIDYTVQLEMVAALAEKYEAHVLMDNSHGSVGDPLLEQLTLLGQSRGFTVEGYQFTNSTKKALIETLQIGMQDRDIELPDIPVLRNELEIFEYVMTRAGNLTYSAPKGAHDDAVISLALAYMAAKTPKGPLMWSVSEDGHARSLEMGELPENNLMNMMVIEKPPEEWEEEGTWIEIDGMETNGTKRKRNIFHKWRRQKRQRNTGRLRSDSKRDIRPYIKLNRNRGTNDREYRQAA